jgi:hypothetical protein
MPSFTSQIPNLQTTGPVVETRIVVGSVLETLLRQSNQPIPTAVPTLAMIDTGATGTVIRDDIPPRLGLQPVGVSFINTPSSTNVRCYEYMIRLIFPNNVVVEATVISAPLQGQQAQCLIGRDVLSHGVLIYIGYINTFSLSF